mmetsp:Transcript_162410/g.299656  ORF Transcript_162410/g.299656 Transcript_162410/m.299656 type:complete len:88 (-) Transcript_162410:48-311(-)
MHRHLGQAAEIMGVEGGNYEDQSVSSTTRALTQVYIRMVGPAPLTGERVWEICVPACIEFSAGDPVGSVERLSLPLQGIFCSFMLAS